MMKRWVFVLSAMCVLLMSTTVFAVYYQYTDKENVVRYTDDPSLIPENQRSDVKVFESVRSQFVPGADQSQESAVQDQASPASPNSEAAAKMDELNAKRKELRDLFNALKAVREALGDPPSRYAKTSEKSDYAARVKQLNQKIDEYDQRTKEFKEALKAYNDEFGGK